jgi:ribosome-associated protein
VAESEDIVIRPGVVIPAAELRFQFTRSGGPGGQHVNKASTQAELTFDLARSPSLTDEQKRRIAAALPSYVSREGVLRVACQSSRSQAQNREEAVARFQALLSGALYVPKARRATRPSRAAKERRLAAKKRRSQVKTQRRLRRDESA